MVTCEYTIRLQAFFINFSTQVAGIHSAPMQSQLANVLNSVAHLSNLETKAEILQLKTRVWHNSLFWLCLWSELTPADVSPLNCHRPNTNTPGTRGQWREETNFALTRSSFFFFLLDGVFLAGRSKHTRVSIPGLRFTCESPSALLFSLGSGTRATASVDQIAQRGGQAKAQEAESRGVHGWEPPPWKTHWIHVIGQCPRPLWAPHFMDLLDEN
jgi:hypothetical protein